jgi:NADH-quinone oxidoreductase subunit E
MEVRAKSQLDEIFSQYEGTGSDLIPILQAVQGELGYLPEEALEEIAKFLRLPASTVYGVSTFYAQFKFVPMGKKIVKVCRGTACHVRGADQILREIESRLCIKPGETSDDLEYTLETVACIGACALAPTIVVNNDVHGKLSTKMVREIFDDRSKRE